MSSSQSHPSSSSSAGQHNPIVLVSTTVSMASDSQWYPLTHEQLEGWTAICFPMTFDFIDTQVNYDNRQSAKFIFWSSGKVSFINENGKAGHGSATFWSSHDPASYSSEQYQRAPCECFLSFHDVYMKFDMVVGCGFCQEAWDTLFFFHCDDVVGLEWSSYLSNAGRNQPPHGVLRLHDPHLARPW
jgi:hypothetical protein